MKRSLKRKGEPGEKPELLRARAPRVEQGGGAALRSRMKQVDRWLKMAGAMDQALDRIRIAYQLVKHLEELHTIVHIVHGDEGRQDCFACHPGNWKPLLDELTEVANILRVGLKAR